MSVVAAESLKPASSSCDGVHALDVFGGVSGEKSEVYAPDVFGDVSGEADRFGNKKEGKMAVFGDGSIKYVNDYE